MTNTGAPPPLAMPVAPQIPILGAIAVVYHQGRVLLIQRKNPPNAGAWGFPGGHVELGETALAAARRELAEETGIHARPLEYLTNIDVMLHDAQGQVEKQYLLTAVLCAYESGTAQAADDALDARWLAVDSIEQQGLALIEQVAAVARLARARSL
ncbi:NUDIX hydrolase [Pseudophaeobacter profundi]|uniref:NUDIX hydrolase n=1 Tax=Pseudophaeobacter profundi TaxID=3034152 RepID=UPI002431BC12|nr:NUDIX hydrolase [Pseudophaeobacter profundi]